VSDSEATAIRRAFEESGELAAAVELRRLFPGVPHERARECARIIAGWSPLPVVIPRPRKRLRSRRASATRQL